MTAPAPIQYGIPLNVSATVVPPSGFSGDLTQAQVQFTVLNGTTQVFSTTVPANSSGIASATINGLAPGNDQLQAQVVGNTFSSPVVSAPITINPASATLTVATPGLVAYGSPLNLSATVVPPAGSTGDLTKAQVQFTVSNGPTQVAPVTVAANSSGVANATINGLAPGQYMLQAQVVGGYYTSSPIPTTPLSFTVGVAVATLNMTAPSPITYGSPLNLTATVVPPAGSSGDLTQAQVQFTVLNGTTQVTSTTVSANSSGVASATINGLAAGSYTLQAQVVGNFYTSAAISFPLTVNPSSLTLNLATPAPIAVGNPLNVSATVVPPPGFTGDLTQVQVQFSLLDTNGNQVGQSITANANSAGAVKATFTNPSLGIYQLQAQVIGNYTSSAVSALAVVYDPSVTSSITGSAGINSPAGSYPAKPKISGSTSFGLNIQYSGGAPTGQTQYQFQAVNMNFHSSSYDWMVVLNGRGQYQGSGTINSSGNYGFMATVINNNPDLFRMKIWDKSTGKIVYDSQIGAPDWAAPNQPLTGGSITIHQ